MTTRTIQLFRDGLISLQQNQCSVAQRLFQECLIYLAQSVETEASLSATCLVNANSLNLFAETFTLELDLFSERVTPHNLFHLFDRVFIPANDMPTASASAMCIYNVAFTHHVHALTTSHRSSLSFRQALHFYRLDLKATCSFSDFFNNPQDPMLPLALAILNNVGHIHCHFFKTNEMRDVSDAIYQLVPNLRCHQGIAESDALFFFSCTISNQTTMQGAAAA